MIGYDRFFNDMDMSVFLNRRTKLPGRSMSFLIEGAMNYKHKGDAGKREQLWVLWFH